MEVLGFDWNKANRSKCEKHGISCISIERFFRQETWIAPDPKHSESEERFIAIGKHENGRPMFVVFTLRDKLIRPISARFMHAKEAKKYEQAFAKDENR